jgi:hypothetical protein
MAGIGEPLINVRVDDFKTCQIIGEDNAVRE